MPKRPVLTGEHFMNGDLACAEGALSAGCKFFAGYPITPATEIAEHMSWRLPQINGIYIQMEDEIASMAAILGASNAGIKSMTSTSGPGFSLMMENIGLGMITETPCVIVNIQRGGPSTGLPTLVGQGDMMQARWGSHGDYEVIALSPSSIQEMYDFTIEAFNLSERFRLPVFVMSDEVVGHMTERLKIPFAHDIPIYDRKRPRRRPENFYPFEPDEDLVPPMACAGEGFKIHVTGLTHDDKGYPVINEEAQYKLVKRLVDKIRVNARRIINIKEMNVEDADIVIVAYGIIARVAHYAMMKARERGIKVGLLKLNTVWPFPENRVAELSEHVKSFIVPEINFGQIYYEVQRCAGCNANTVLIPHAGGNIHNPRDILDVIRRETR
jgi:2-oxoglutarate ferredoxin oxidoreductase subunit alpha